MSEDTMTLSEWRQTRWPDLRDKLFFVVGIAILAWALGYATTERTWFPKRHIDRALLAYAKLEEMLGWKLPWYYQEAGNIPAVKLYQPNKLAPGLTLVTGLGSENHPEARVIDSTGKVYHRWSINWFDLWPDAKHVAASSQHVALPGPHIHGVLLQANGDLVFNLERGGLFRLDACGHVRWKLPHMTHHSLFQDEEGNFWVPDLRKRKMNDPRLPGYTMGTDDYYLLKVSEAGKILHEWRIFDLMLNNGLESYLYITSQLNDNAHMKGDTLHFNDAEIFPRTMSPGVFQPGDVMISLRNINMVLIFDPETGKVRHIFNGPFIRQHDPDFADGNSITVFDNYNQTMDTPQQRSRLLQVYADSRPARVLFEGNKAHPFFTNIMGKQQALPDGNYLLTESVNGRALEVDEKGQPVWEYRNFVREGVTGMIDEAQRLPVAMNADFFARARRSCRA